MADVRSVKTAILAGNEIVLSASCAAFGVVEETRPVRGADIYINRKGRCGQAPSTVPHGK